MLDNQEVSTEMNDDQIDSLLNGSGQSRDIPMESKPQAQAEEYTLNVNGKEIKAPRDKVLQWAQMGYNYPQRAQELNQKQQEFEKQRQEYEAKFKDYETKYSPYKQIDEWAQQNQEKWQQLQSAWQEQTAAQSGTPPEISKLKEELLNELKPVKEFIQTSLSEKQAQKLEQEDKELSTEIESIRKQYADTDFDTPDAEGKSLEMKILEHAMNNGIKSFRTAYRDYYHEHLVGKAQEQGKEQVTKEIQKRSKLGILSESSKPTQGLKMAENTRNKTYDQLMHEALAEINGG